VILGLILGLVGYMMAIALRNKRINTGLLEGQTVEAL
jgi:hypothetical protein